MPTLTEPTIRQKLEERARLVAEQRRTIDEADRAKRPLTGEERERFDAMDADLEALDKELEQANAEFRDEDRRKRLAEREAESRRPSVDAWRGVGRDSRRPRPGSKREILASPEYREAFLGLLQGRPEEYRERFSGLVTRDILTSTANAPMPVEMERRIVELLQLPVNLLSVCTQYTVDSDRKIPVESGIGSAAIIGEGNTITPNDFSFGTQLTVNDFTLATAIQLTMQAMADGVDMEEYTSRKVAQRLTNGVETQLAAGVGTTAPTGISKSIVGGQLNSSTAAILAASATGGDVVIDLVHKVLPQYRGGAKFRMVMHDDYLKVIRKIKSTTNEYIWKPSTLYSDIRDGVPGTIYGVPYLVNNFMPTAVGAAADPVIVVADFSFYEVYWRGGTTIIVDPYTLSLSLKTIVVAARRMDAFLTLTSAAAGLRLTA
jgi:HK97 family phage major capsid protein